MKATRVFAGWMILLGCTVLAPAQEQSVLPARLGPSGYSVVKTIPLGGIGLWDRITVDVAARRLYVPRDSYIAVLDADSGAVVGNIPGLEGVHGVALAPELGRGFATNGRANTVTIFDLNTFHTIATARTGSSPDAVVYDSVSKTAFALNLRDHSITAINAVNGAPRGTMRLVDSPESAVVDGKGNLYVNMADPAEIAVIDTTKLSLRRRMRLAPCQEPRGLAMDVSHGRLFTGCSNEMMVVTDVATGRLLAKLPIGARTGSVVFDSDQQLVFAANGVGTLTVVREESPNTFKVVENLETKRGARIMALDSQTHRIFLATAVFQSSAQIEDLSLMEPDSFVVLIAGK